MLQTRQIGSEELGVSMDLRGHLNYFSFTSSGVGITQMGHNTELSDSGQ